MNLLRSIACARACAGAALAALSSTQAAEPAAATSASASRHEADSQLADWMFLRLALGLPAKAAVQARASEPPGSVVARAERVESEIQAALQRTVDRQRRIEGQRGQVVVDAWFNQAGTALNINLSDEYRPRWYGAEMEDLLHELATVAEERLRERGLPARVQITIAGQTLDALFPEPKPRAR